MSEKIKEILDDKKVIIDQHWNYIIIGNEKYYDLPKRLLDYITNLQEKLRVSQTNEETYRLEMLDITKCLGLDEDTIFDEVKEKATNLQEETERQSKAQVILDNQIAEMFKYKQRNEKAIEYITEDDVFYYGDELYDSYQEIVNILKGDKDE